MLDTTITFAANANVTLLLTGSARAKTVKFVVLTDNPPAAAAGQIAVRAVNTATGAIDAYVVSYDGGSNRRPVRRSPTSCRSEHPPTSRARPVLPPSV